MCNWSCSFFSIWWYNFCWNLAFFFSFSHEKLRSKTIMLRYSHTLQLTHKKRKKHMERERGAGAGGRECGSFLYFEGLSVSIWPSVQFVKDQANSKFIVLFVWSRFPFFFVFLYPTTMCLKIYFHSCVLRVGADPAAVHPPIDDDGWLNVIWPPVPFRENADICWFT